MRDRTWMNLSPTAKFELRFSSASGPGRWTVSAFFDSFDDTNDRVWSHADLTSADPASTTVGTGASVFAQVQYFKDDEEEVLVVARVVDQGTPIPNLAGETVFEGVLKGKGSGAVSPITFQLFA